MKDEVSSQISSQKISLYSIPETSIVIPSSVSPLDSLLNDMNILIDIYKGVRSGT